MKLHYAFITFAGTLSALLIAACSDSNTNTTISTSSSSINTISTTQKACLFSTPTKPSLCLHSLQNFTQSECQALATKLGQTVATVSLVDSCISSQKIKQCNTATDSGVVLIDVLDSASLGTCGTTSTSSSSSTVVNSCIMSKFGATQECVQFVVPQTQAGCVASAGDMGDTTGVVISASTGCPAGSVAHCDLLDSATRKKIMTYFGYDSTAPALCAMINAM